MAAFCAPSASALGSMQDTPSGISFQYLINPDGSGGLVANPPGGQGTIGWASCVNSGTDCAPIASGSDSDRVLNVGDTPAGTVFEVTATSAGQTATERTVPYRGRVRWTEPPALAGAPRVNSFVQPIPGKWEGGWGLEASYVQLQVCRTYAAQRCLVISDTNYWNGCPGTGATIAKRYEGWYVRTVDQRNGDAMPLPAIAYMAPEAIRPAMPGPAVASTPPLRILPAAGPAARRCGQSHERDHASLNSRVSRQRGSGKPRVGNVTCFRGCRFTVTVRRRDWSKTFVRRVAIGTFSKDVVLPPKLHARLRGTRPRITVEIDGRRAASRRVWVPAPTRRD